MATRMPFHGLGFTTVEPWSLRNSRYGTHELTSLLQRAAGSVARRHPGGKLGIADLSKKRGGPISSHRSHQNGRDADLVYFAVDANGAPFYPDRHMAFYLSDGQANSARAPRPAKRIPTRYFDLKRNWSLVRALVFDPHTTVVRIFVSQQIKRWLLDYATELGESKNLVAWTEEILLPSTGEGNDHNDHMHVRISCSERDIRVGQCLNTNSPQSWAYFANSSLGTCRDFER